MILVGDSWETPSGLPDEIPSESGSAQSLGSLRGFEKSAFLARSEDARARRDRSRSFLDRRDR